MNTIRYSFVRSEPQMHSKARAPPGYLRFTYLCLTFRFAGLRDVGRALALSQWYRS